ncbi:MAG: hypothetical protein ACRCTS_03590 [Fusobacteriaceae bacterium]
MWEKEECSEKPVSIETYNSYVTLENSENEGIIYTYGLKEYEEKKEKLMDYKMRGQEILNLITLQ